MKKKGRIPQYKRCSNDLDIIFYLYSLSVKIITKHQRKRSELMEISTTYLNQTFSQTYKNFFKTKLVRTTTLNEFKLITSTGWIERYQPLTVDMTKDKFCLHYRLRLNSISVPKASPF